MVLVRATATEPERIEDFFGVIEIDGPLTEAIQAKLRIAQKWDRISGALNLASEREAQEFAVQRARKIWASLGRNLQKWTWAKAFRKRHFTPVFIKRFLKRWIRQ